MLNNIDAERARLRLSRQDLATKLNVSCPTLRGWINEVNPIPSSKLRELSEIFNCSIDYILARDKELQPTG